MPPDLLETKEICDLQPRARPFKVSDERGLYLLVMPNGAKYWRFKYRLAGKEKTLALGVYPKVSLDAARARRDEARQVLVIGGDPMAAKRDAVMQSKALATMPPAFQLSMTGDALTIQTKGETLTLTPEQTAAVRTFLIATP